MDYPCRWGVHDLKPVLVLEGSGEELLAQADIWKGRSHLKLIEIADTDFRSRLPDDVMWDGNVPLVPRRGRTEPVTDEMVKACLEDSSEYE